MQFLKKKVVNVEAFWYILYLTVKWKHNRLLQRLYEKYGVLESNRLLKCVKKLRSRKFIRRIWKFNVIKNGMTKFKQNLVLTVYNEKNSVMCMQ